MGCQLVSWSWPLVAFVLVLVLLPAVITLQRPEEKINHWAEYAREELALLLTVPGRCAQCFVQFSTQNHVQRSVSGNEDVEHVAQHGLQRCSGNKQVVNVGFGHAQRCGHGGHQASIALYR